MEKRIFIFVDHAGNIITRVPHDTSLIQSLPRPGDEVYDLYPPKHDMSNPISGLVQRI